MGFQSKEYNILVPEVNFCFAKKIKLFHVTFSSRQIINSIRHICFSAFTISGSKLQMFLDFSSSPENNQIEI